LILPFTVISYIVKMFFKHDIYKYFMSGRGLGRKILLVYYENNNRNTFHVFRNLNSDDGCFVQSKRVSFNTLFTLGSRDRASWAKCEERENQQDATIRCLSSTTAQHVCRMRALLASYIAAPHNRYQPHPAEPAQYTMCGNTVFVLLKMGIMMPETCWDRSWW
jgi:hypothetical protein